MVTGLAMEIGGRLMEGEFVESIKARKVYEEIVDQMQDPALLEWQQGGWFKLRVFPIEAKSEKRVVLRYAAPLMPSIEGYEYRYLATPPEQNPVGHFALYLEGKLVSEQRDMQRGTDVVLAFPESAVPNECHRRSRRLQLSRALGSPRDAQGIPSQSPATRAGNRDG